jgi:TRAP transporter 4TM/12TM fusion protein
MALIGRLLTVLGVAMALFHMALTQVALLPSVLVQDAHLGVALLILFLSAVAVARSGWSRLYHAALGAAALFCALYVAAQYDTLIAAQGFPRPVDVIVGVVAIFLVLEATRQSWGPVLPIIAVLGTLYYIFGDRLPPSWGAPFTPFDTIISNLSIGLYSGIFGQFMAISANDIFLFMVFGGLLEALDGNKSFTEIGKAISRVFPGGAGLTTVVSSSLMGMVTGAAVANVAICGTYTIPLMKREGYSARTAAAIEATASTGGQIVPPVMGSVAFVMAALLAVPYFDIAVTAIIPAVFYYVGVLAAVFLKSRRIGIRRQADRPDKVVLFFFLPLFIVPLALMTVLLASLFSVAYAAFYSIVALVAMRLVLLFAARLLPAEIRARLPEAGGHSLAADLAQFLRKLIAGLRGGAIQGAGIAVVMGTVGLLAEAITATGAAVPLGWAVDWISGSSLLLALISTAVVCTILGAGVPTVGAYVLTAAIAGPIVIGNGVDPYTANFFILYFACLSAITPPVAAAALAASAIASAPYMRTAWEATWLAVMLYILPFLFVYEPALLGRQTPGLVGMIALLAELTLLCVLVAVATQGWLIHPLSKLERLVFAVAAVAGTFHIAADPSLALAVELAACALGVAMQWRAHRRAVSGLSVVPGG